MALSSKVTKALAKLSKQDKNGLFGSEIADLKTSLEGVADKEALKLVKAESKAVKAGNKYYNSAFKASSDEAYAVDKAKEAKAATEAGDKAITKAEIKNIKANIKAVKAAVKAAVKSDASEEYVQAVMDSAEAGNAKVFAQLTKQLKKGKVSDSDAVKLAKALDDAEDLSKADVKELVAALKKGDAGAAIDKVEEIVKGEEGGDGDGDGDGDVTPDPEAPATFKLEYIKSVHENEAVEFVVTASKPVEEDTEVTFTVRAADATAADQNQDGKTNLNDFGQGTLTTVTVVIKKGETTASHAVTAIDDGKTESDEVYFVDVKVNGKELETAEVTVKDGQEGGGQTFVLTKDVDYLPGLKGSLGTTDTSGNDTIRGLIQAAPADTTFNALDEIDGGAGRDTLKLADSAGGAITLGNVKNVEVIEISGTTAVTVDSAGAEGAEELNVVKAGGAVSATAADTTDINIEMKALDIATGTVETLGGKDVTVKLTDLVDTSVATVVFVGQDTTGATKEAASGDVVVEMTGKAYKAGTTATLGDVTVNGGKTISVTQKATSDDSKAATDATVGTITQGKVTIVADTATTDITVKQDATVGSVGASTTTTGGSAETQSVKFAALKATESITIAGLTFTASKNMSAEDVAKAFANLAEDTAADLISGFTDNDTQAGGSNINGVYTGATNTSWISGDAQGDTVVFTKVGGTAWAMTNSSTAAPVATVTAAVTGTTTTNSDGVLGVAAGVVTITGNTALKNVTVDGYDITAVATTNNTALSEINLSNGGGMTIASAAATLDLSLENVGGAIAFTTAPETLNIKSVGDNTIGTLTAAATKSLNVSGTGLLSAGTAATLTATETIKVTDTAGLTLAAPATLTALTSVDTTGTTGTVTMTIDTEKATYTGGDGVDNVTVAAGKKVEKAINLGAGHDTFDMSTHAAWTAGTTIKTGVVVDGGDGTDTLKIASAFANGLAATFKDAHKNFERLELTASTAANTVDLENVGLNKDITLNGVANATTLTLNNLANYATIVLAAVNATGTADGTLVASLKDATGSSDVLNVTTVVSTTGEDFGILQADGVETINLSAIDTELVTPDVTGSVIQTATLEVKSDAVTTITVAGNSALELKLAATTTELATVNASANNGGLTLDLSAYTSLAGVTVTGGDGNDVIKASVGATARADVINGGAGNDTIHTGTNGAVLTGGEGNDLFVLAAATAGGNKDANTYSTITDFSAGDLLQLDTVKGAGVTFTKLTANLNESTAVFSDYVNAAIEQAQAITTGTVGDDAVYFNYKGDAYIVVNQNDGSTDVAGAFQNGFDQIVKLTGINGDNLSFNATQGTVGLI